MWTFLVLLKKCCTPPKWQRDFLYKEHEMNGYRNCHLNWSSGSRLNPFPPPPKRSVLWFDCDVITDATAADMEVEVNKELADVDTAAPDDTGLSENKI